MVYYFQEIFFGGFEQDVRPDAWRFLLCYYPFDSTYEERIALKKEKEEFYWKIDADR